MSKEMRNTSVRSALNAYFADMDALPSVRNQVLARAKGEVKAKKKLSVGLVLAIVLVLAVVGALATLALTWNDAAKYLEKETREGKFDTWTGEEKTELVRSLAKAGAIEDNTELERLLSGELSDSEASLLAEKLMTEWLEAPIDRVAFMPIVEKLWGELRSWTLEQKAWFTQTLDDAGVLKPDHERYVLPDETVISARDAEHIARAYCEIWAGVQAGAYSQYETISEYIIFPRKDKTTGKYPTEGTPPVWWIELSSGSTGQGTWYVEINPVNGHTSFSNIIGKLRYKKYDVYWNRNAVSKAMAALDRRQHISNFFSWSIEEKAQWTKEIFPLVEQQADLDALDIATIAFTRYRYGIPDESAISQLDALTAAKQGIIESFDIAADRLMMYDNIYTYYDVTDTDKPIWRFHMSMNGRHAIEEYGSIYNITNYRVEVDARTGDIVSVHSYQLDSVTGYEAILMWV